MLNSYSGSDNELIQSVEWRVILGGGGGWVVCGVYPALSGEGMEQKGRVGNGPMLGTDGVWCWSAWWRVAGTEDSKGVSGVRPGSAAQAGAHSASGKSSDEPTSTGIVTSPPSQGLWPGIGGKTQEGTLQDGGPYLQPTSTGQQRHLPADLGGPGCRSL